VVSDIDVRQWLTLLRRPDRLGQAGLVDLLRAHDRLPDSVSGAAAGQAAAEFLVGAIDRLRPADGASREERLPHLVLTTCFVEGAKLFQAANKLGMSERQLSRERRWAIELLRAEVEAALGEPAEETAYQPEPIPTIGDYLRRPQVMQELQEALAASRLVVVAGPPGIGKTSLVAELAASVSGSSARVFWYRFRPGVNDSIQALLYEIGALLASERRTQLADYIERTLPAPDIALATRMAITGLGGADRLLVFDDYHVVEEADAVRGLLDDAVTRLPQLRAVVVSRHQDAGPLPGRGFGVPVFSRHETAALLAQQRVEAAPELVDALHSWTTGVPHLVHLAAAWLKNAPPDEVASGMPAFTSRAQVQSFLLGTITELLDDDDRAILEAASIFRGKFSDDGVAAVARRSRGAVLDASLRLVRAHAATRSRDGDTAFFHASVRDYVYDRLSPEQLATLHPRAAEWFDAIGQPEDAAYHREQARGAPRSG
jgi:ATP/maltotriose-dependent transcriptional regulator MalT